MFSNIVICYLQAACINNSLESADTWGKEQVQGLSETEICFKIKKLGGLQHYRIKKHVLQMYETETHMMLA